MDNALLSVIKAGAAGAFCFNGADFGCFSGISVEYHSKYGCIHIYLAAESYMEIFPNMVAHR
jgi:hypothetical protein